MPCAASVTYCAQAAARQIALLTNLCSKWMCEAARWFALAYITAAANVAWPSRNYDGRGYQFT